MLQSAGGTGVPERSIAHSRRLVLDESIVWCLASIRI